MKIAILGTGTVGQTIGHKLIQLGHQLMMGSRTAQNEKALTFVNQHPQHASAGTFEQAAAFGEIVFNCTSGLGSLNALQQAKAENLANKVLIDLANPLDFSNGMPPSLSICNTHSLGEEIQNHFPETKVVKTLNTMWCGLMVNPQLVNGGDHHVFVCGNDANAKAQVKDLLISFGWANHLIIDLGDLSKARGTEMYLPLWLSLFGHLKTSAFNLKVVH